MSSKIKIIISALAVAILLTAGAAAIVVAQENSASLVETSKGIMARAAEV